MDAEAVRPRLGGYGASQGFDDGGSQSGPAALPADHQRLIELELDAHVGFRRMAKAEVRREPVQLPEIRIIAPHSQLGRRAPERGPPARTQVALARSRRIVEQAHVRPSHL